MNGCAPGLALIERLKATFYLSSKVAALMVLCLEALSSLFVLLSSQRVSSHPCGSMLADPERNTHCKLSPLVTRIHLVKS